MIEADVADPTDSPAVDGPQAAGISPEAHQLDVRPPNEPWRDLSVDADAGGFLSFYYADQLSAVAVRGVTLPANNKSDPNLETKTYGLFSICGHGMRASIVGRRCRYIVFLTRQQGRRVIVGYYRVRWYALGPLVTVSKRAPDYALAADQIRFVHPPIAIEDLPKHVRSVVATRFRVFKHVEPPVIDALVSFIRARPDRTADYLREIDRLERFNKYRTGYRYVNWSKATPWSWEDAAKYLTPKPLSITTSGGLRGATDFWRCKQCAALMFSKARLKSCPHCGAMSSLESASPRPVP